MHNTSHWHISHIPHISHILLHLTWDICKCISFLDLYASRYRFLINICMSELCYWTSIQHSSFNMVLNMIWCMRWDSLNTTYSTSSITHNYNRISYVRLIIYVIINQYYSTLWFLHCSTLWFLHCSTLLLLNTVISQHCH